MVAATGWLPATHRIVIQVAFGKDIGPARVVDYTWWDVELFGSIACIPADSLDTSETDIGLAFRRRGLAMNWDDRLRKDQRRLAYSPRRAALERGLP